MMLMAEIEGVKQSNISDVGYQVDDGTISWTASEFIAHQKTVGWYGILAAAALVVTIFIFLLTRDLITSGFVIFGALILGYYASRQPNELHYQINANGVEIGHKNYGYESFKSFSIVDEGAFSSVVFMPLKRFAPIRAIYFAPEHEDKIIEMLMPRLPFEEYSHDAIDRLMSRIRF